MRNNYWMILQKELIDIVRDKRSFIMLFVPVLILPVMFTLMNMGGDKGTTKNIPCAVAYAAPADETRFTAFCKTIDDEMVKADQLQQGEHFIQPIPLNGETVEEAMQNGKIYVSIRVDGANLVLDWNKKSTNSVSAGNTISSIFLLIGQETVNNALDKHDASLQSFGSFRVVTPAMLKTDGASDENDARADSTDQTAAIMATVAPMVLVMLIMSGGVSVAVDLFAGEKERGTFESLLTTQVSRTSLLLAKSTAVFIISFAGMLLSISAYMVSFIVTERDGGKISEIIPPRQALTVLLICLSLTVFAVSLMTLLSLRAKTVKEAQSQMSILTILPTLLSAVTMNMDVAQVKEKQGLMLIPVFNAIVCIKTALSNAQNISGLIALTCVSCLVYSAVMWVLCVRLLNSEKLLRG